VISRRSLLLAPAALAFGQNTRPGVAVVWITGKTVPADFARQSVVFPRAYAACPRTRRALETGKFPHALRADDGQLSDLLRSGASEDANTITILTAESGDGRDSPSEQSIHVPLAIRWPGKLAPRVASETLISHVDLLPTLLGWAGIASGELQGRDLSRLIETGQGEVPESIYAEGQLGQPGDWRVVVRGFDKLVLNIEDQATALYNLADDPAEATNLLREREHALTRDALLALARIWRQRTSDRVDPSGLRTRP
jgi:hypothetical protein